MNTTKFINRLSFWVLSKTWVTCLWLPVLLLAWVFVEPAFSWAGIKVVGIAAGLLFLAGLVIPQFWYAVPVLGDVWRAYQKRAVRRGREALAACTLVSKADAEHCKAKLMGRLWEFDCPAVASNNDGAGVFQLISDHLGWFGAKDMEVVEHDDSGHWMIRFLKQPDMKAPIRRLHVLTEFPELRADTSSIEYGVDGFGDEQYFFLRNQSGMLVGGMPGAGKSAGMQVVVGSLLTSPNAQVHVIDAKGGADWSWTEDMAQSYIGDSSDFDAVLELLESIQVEMYRRQSGIYEEFGVANFWDKRLSRNCPLICLVIDEVQTFLDVRGAGKQDKEKITAIIADLIKKGRSAGIFLILATQKPTADAIPTAIRDNIGIRVCFHVATREAEQAVLGYPAENNLSLAYTIPADNPGQAVVVTHDGFRRNVKFSYVPPYILKRYAEQARQEKEGAAL